MPEVAAEPVVLKPRDGRGAPLTARILPGLPVRLALDGKPRATSTNLALLLEHYVIMAATDDERAALAAAGISTRQHYGMVAETFDESKKGGA